MLTLAEAKREDEEMRIKVWRAKSKGLVSDKQLPPLSKEEGVRLRESIDREIKKRRDAEKFEDFAEWHL